MFILQVGVNTMYANPKSNAVCSRDFSLQLSIPCLSFFYTFSGAESWADGPQLAYSAINSLDIPFILEIMFGITANTMLPWR